MMNPNTGCLDAKTLLNKIRALDFVAIESVLYLDAYKDADALAYHQKAVAERDELVDKYEENFGPLTSSGVNCENGWTWVETPWPWELEAN